METQNFTVRLPKDLLRKAKFLAARRDTSVSALLTEKLKELVEHDVDGLARDELSFLHGTTRISDVLRRTLGAGALEYQTAWAHWQDLVQTLRLSNEGGPIPAATKRMSAEFVDTNVLLYAFSEDEPVKRERAQRLLERLWESGTGRLSTQVLQEFYVNATRKLARALSSKEAQSDRLEP